MPNMTLHLKTPRDRQARSVQASRVSLVPLDLGELALLDLTVFPGSDVTTSNAVEVERQLVLVPGPTFAQLIPTPAEQIATVKSLFAEVVGLTCACTVTPSVT